MYIIKDSLINGKGLFAERDIRKGEKILKVTGEKVPYREFHDKYGTDTKNSIKVLNWYYISFKEEPYLSQNDIRFINEGLEFNVKYSKGHIIALENILKDSELLLKYPKNYPRDYTLG
jgi:hypothetical protein